MVCGDGPIIARAALSPTCCHACCVLHGSVMYCVVCYVLLLYVVCRGGLRCVVLYIVFCYTVYFLYVCFEFHGAFALSFCVHSVVLMYCASSLCFVVFGLCVALCLCRF